MAEKTLMEEEEVQNLLKMFSGLIASISDRTVLEAELDEFGKVYDKQIPDWRSQLPEVMKKENPGAEALKFL